MTTLIIALSTFYFTGWLTCARILRRRWIRKLVPTNKNGTSFSVPEVTIEAMFAGVVWWAFLLYVLVSLDFPAYRSRKIRRNAYIAAMEIELHGQVVSLNEDSHTGTPGHRGW